MSVGLGVEVGSDEEGETSEVTTGVDVVTSVDSATSDVAEEIANSNESYPCTSMNRSKYYSTYVST